jgi:predicted N-acetyltransferase YhbS
VLGPGEALAIAELCRRALDDPPDEAELRAVLFAEDRPALVRGDPERGVVATRAEGTEGFVKLLCVSPEARGKGLGRALLAAAERDLARAGARRVTVGADAPYFLWPGVATSWTAMLCLLERCRYRRAEANFNMRIELRAIPADPGGARVADPSEEADLAAFADRYWPAWKAEVLRALRNGTLVVTDDDQGIAGFCAYEVNRRGTLGPVAVRHDLIGRRAGEPALLHALHRMRASGLEEVEVLWVGPIVPYARVGGRVSRVFFVYRRDLA